MSPIWIALLVFLVACDSAGPPSASDVSEAGGTRTLVLLEQSVDGDLEFSTADDSAIAPILANHSDRTVYLRVPGETVSAERQTRDGWEAIPMWYGTLASLPGPYAVPVGTTLSLSELPMDAAGLEAGVYRFRVAVFEDPEGTKPLPEPEVVSVEFTVVIPS